MSEVSDRNWLAVDDGLDPSRSAGVVESHLVALEDRLRELPADQSVARATLAIDMGRALVELDRKQEAWARVREAFDVLIEAGEWEKAADACEVLFLSEQEESLAALGQGIWLAVTYPVDPDLTVTLLNHVIDETPDDADGAAVAAATAVYIVDLRCEGKQHDNLSFFANQLLGNVARRHSGIEHQNQFDIWVAKLELNEPQKFLVRLRNVVDVLVQDQWWFDRDQLASELPDQ